MVIYITDDNKNLSLNINNKNSYKDYDSIIKKRFNIDKYYLTYNSKIINISNINNEEYNDKIFELKYCLPGGNEICKVPSFVIPIITSVGAIIYFSIGLVLLLIPFLTLQSKLNKGAKILLHNNNDLDKVMKLIQC